MHEESDKSQARMVQDVHAMSLNNGVCPTLADAADMARPTTIVHLALHQTRQMISRKDVCATVIIVNDYLLVDTLDTY